MADIEKQVLYWCETSKDDWRVAKKLIADKEVLHGLFFVHLTIEKALKAHVCKHTKKYAPLIHNLLSLARMTPITLTPEQESFLTEINTYNIRGRYPDIPIKVTSLQEAKSVLVRAEDFYEWLIKQL